MGFFSYLAVTALCIIGVTIFPPALCLVGLSSAGPVAGAMFAGAQSGLAGGAIASGSWMAAAQTAAMLSPTP